MLSSGSISVFANAVHQKKVSIQNCCSFIDGTVCPVCRMQQNQRISYNQHKKTHAIKFLSVVTPNGLIEMVDGPYEGAKHRNGMLKHSSALSCRKCSNITLLSCCCWISSKFWLFISCFWMASCSGFNVSSSFWCSWFSFCSAH